MTAIVVNTNRITNGYTHPNVATKPKSRKPEQAPKSRQKAVFATGKDHLRLWCHSYIATAAGLSAGLNGYAAQQHADVKWAAWALGIAIPALVLMLFRVAGLLAKRNLIKIAVAIGCIGSTLLFLSVWHCSDSIHAISGMPVFLSVAFAIGIDCGIVGCEVASLMR